MRLSIPIILAVSSSSLAAVTERAACNADSCARAVTGTRRGISFQSSARADCAKFLATTVTLPAETTTLVETVTTVIPGSEHSINERAEGSSTNGAPIPTTGVPSYATPCSNAVKYASACSCWGVSGSTETVTAEAELRDWLKDNTEALQELIDPNTGISFVNVDGRATLAMDIFEGLTTYHLVAMENGPSGVFDLVSDSGKFVAIFEDGHVGFVDASSNGQDYVADGNGAKSVTTVWSVTCDGGLVAGILGVHQFELGVVDNDLYAHPMSPAIHKECWAQQFGSSRCPNPDLSPVVKWQARDPSANGCGSQGFMWNYPPFVGCCKDHDYCFDDCNLKFKDCNDKFETCTANSCDTYYTGSSIESTVNRLGCKRLAASFAWIVSSEIGRAVFNIANRERCECCKPGEKSCQSGCADVLTDPNNCGDCGIVCPSGKCLNGVCSEKTCDGKTCGNFQSCAGNDCYCFTTADGTGFCAQDAFCSGLKDCASNADCGSGNICAVGSCCGRNVCLAGSCGNPALRLMRMARRGHFDGNSAAFVGTWVQ
ncbi:hypothetical protein H2199_009300 [Coniosporium tulheliwenetii]|uniref:Uncharacterized protein n=1 Tax=Coniosporium tulheliwenetii TaxID=3383036 RepID=A0ACC2YE78_9PEZI|nr:hypothetical protein H2199_009300 [Cladosporium sp. JES 115]